MTDAPTCPYCYGEIHPDAKKCRHCGEWLAPQSSQVDPAMGSPIQPEIKNCPHCHAGEVVSLGHQLYREGESSYIWSRWNPGDEPNPHGMKFLLGGASILVLTVIYTNSGAFINNFHENFRDLSIDWLGNTIRFILYASGLASCGVGLWFHSQRKVNIDDWEFKGRMSQEGLVCTACHKAWFPGMEDRYYE